MRQGRNRAAQNPVSGPGAAFHPDRIMALG